MNEKNVSKVVADICKVLSIRLDTPQKQSLSLPYEITQDRREMYMKVNVPVFLLL